MRVSRDQRGAVAVIVAICAVMIFGFAAYAIDSGHLWAARRGLVTAADAAALASAKDYALGKPGCATAAGSFVTSNNSLASVNSCSPSVGLSSGHVTLDAKRSVGFSFAGILGTKSKQIHAITTAEWGIPTGAANLRPFGLCLGANLQMAQWLNLPSGPVGDSGTIRITYGKSQPTACGTNVPGNWGVLDFDGGSNSNNDTKNWTRSGYPGVVSVGQNVPGDTGAYSNSLDTELAFLQSSGQAFVLPVFDIAAGNGSNAQFHIVAFVFVKLVGFKTTGAQAARSMDLVFTRGVISGTCCATTGINTGTRALRICDVNTLTPNTTDSRAC